MDCSPPGFSNAHPWPRRPCILRHCHSELLYYCGAHPSSAVTYSQVTRSLKEGTQTLQFTCEAQSWAGEMQVEVQAKRIFFFKAHSRVLWPNHGPWLLSTVLTGLINLLLIYFVGLGLGICPRGCIGKAYQNFYFLITQKEKLNCTTI